MFQFVLAVLSPFKLCALFQLLSLMISTYTVVVHYMSCDVLHQSEQPLKCFPIGRGSHHRLNGSSRHVLTETSRSYGKAKNSTPTESKLQI